MLKMKKFMAMSMIAVTMCSAILLTGCGTDKDRQKANKTSDLPQSVSMVLGRHAYFPDISLNTESVYSKIYDACYTYGDVSAFVVDGDPYAACHYQLKAPDKKVDSAKRKQLAKNNTKQILSSITDVSAKTPEIDTLTAITKSADTLHSTAGDAQLSMIVYDSGLSTASLLNFAAQNIIEEPVENIIAQLEDLHAIPDLEGIDVVWIGLGQTCGEQTDLTPNYKYKLEEIWRAILKAGGAGSVSFDKTQLSDKEYAGNLPECTVVPVVADSLDIKELAVQEQLPEVIKWDSNSNIKFVGDEDVFIDPEKAMEELNPIAEYLKARPDEVMYVFGTTATDVSGDLGIELSKARAETCKNSLIGAGVNENQILTFGIGQLAHPLRVNDVDVNGNQIEELAQKNRAVIFVRQDSKLIETLFACMRAAE